MMNAQRTEKLQEIFQVILDLPPDADFAHLRRLGESRWDSLAHTSIVAALESEFGIELKLAEMERLTSFEAAELLLEEKIDGTDRIV